MRMFRYMVGDVLAGGCVAASGHDEAQAKVRAFYDELVAQCSSNETYKNAEITVWDNGEGFMLNYPDVVEVYP